MNPRTLPPLTKAQQNRIKLFRREYKGYSKVSIIRKGQKDGHVLITVTYNGQTISREYDQAGLLTATWQQGQLFTPERQPISESGHALLLNMED